MNKNLEHMFRKAGEAVSSGKYRDAFDFYERIIEDPAAGKEKEIAFPSRYNFGTLSIVGFQPPYNLEERVNFNRGFRELFELEDDLFQMDGLFDTEEGPLEYHTLKSLIAASEMKHDIDRSIKFADRAIETFDRPDLMDFFYQQEIFLHALKGGNSVLEDVDEAKEEFKNANDYARERLRKRSIEVPSHPLIDLTKVEGTEDYQEGIHEFINKNIKQDYNINLIKK